MRGGPPVVKRGERYGQDARCWLWAVIAGMGLPYNPVYDRLAEIGIERERQRVGPLPRSPGWILERGWPEMYRDLVARYGPRW